MIPASLLVTKVTWLGKISWCLPHDVHWWSNISGPPRLMVCSNCYARVAKGVA